MTSEPNRRGLLRGLAGLPLIGGSIVLLGQPIRVARPATAAEIAQYVSFCIIETSDGLKRLQDLGLLDHPDFDPRRVTGAYSARAGSQPDITLRAPIVLSAIGYPLAGQVL